MKLFLLFLFFFSTVIILPFNSLFSFNENQNIKILSETIDTTQMRDYKNMVLSLPDGEIYFCLSLPLEIPNEGLPCVIVIAGLEAGQKSLEYISNSAHYALMSYEYPSILKKLENKFPVFEIFTLRKQTLNIPSDILSLVKWVQNQSWSIKNEICVAGYSFGAMFVPAIYHQAQKENINLGPGIIAYAGADLYPLFYTNLPGSKLEKIIKAKVATWLFKPLEPSLHLSHLKGDFLIINGTKDKSIPFEQAKKLQELTPYPKTIINLDEGHMSPKNMELLQKVITISKNWLDEKILKK